MIFAPPHGFTVCDYPRPSVRERTSGTSGSASQGRGRSLLTGVRDSGPVDWWRPGLPGYTWRSQPSPRRPRPSPGAPRLRRGPPTALHSSTHAAAGADNAAPRQPPASPRRQRRQQGVSGVTKPSPRSQRRNHSVTAASARLAVTSVTLASLSDLGIAVTPRPLRTCAPPVMFGPHPSINCINRVTCASTESLVCQSRHSGISRAPDSPFHRVTFPTVTGCFGSIFTTAVITSPSQTHPFI